MRQEREVDGFRLAYTRTGGGPPVVLLHGWPGDGTDYREVVPLLASDADVVVPDLRGFGDSDRHPADPAGRYGAEAQARGVTGLIEELGLARPVLAGYDIGSRVAQAVARARPDLVRALVLSPPLPGIGSRILTPEAQAEYWYQSFHQLDLAERLIDGRLDTVLAYLRNFWSHWSGPDLTPEEEHLRRLAQCYARPGAFTASIAWYRAGAGSVAVSVRERVPQPGQRIGVPTNVLWPTHDPLFPAAWADRVGEFFSDVQVAVLDGAGHFTPVERPREFAAAVSLALE